MKGSDGSVLGEMLADLGCVNVADGSSLLEDLSLEAIMAADPDYIFVVLQGTDSAKPQATFEEALLSNPAWQTLRAVQEGRFYILDQQLYNLKPNARWGRPMNSSRTSSIQTKQGRHHLAAALVLLLGGCVLASLCLGSVPLTPGEMVSALFGKEEGTARNILLLARVPRTFGCLLAGAALAVSGAVIQGVMDNPLAAPNIIGVNSGAGLMVVLLCAFLPASMILAPVAAFFGALAGVLLVLLIAQRTGAARITLVLAGVAISSIFSAGIDAVVTFVPDALNGYSDFRIGGLANLSLARIGPAAVIIFAALIAILSLANDLDVLRLGAEQAQSLGLPAKSRRILLLALAAALAGAAVSFAGLIGFVGLIVPHIFRRLIGEDSFPLLLSCALGGAAFLTVCDLAARLLRSL